jgi:hypothetical protein
VKARARFRNSGKPSNLLPVRLGGSPHLHSAVSTNEGQATILYGQLRNLW